MKKIIASILVLNLMNLTQAQYIIQLPLESLKGGFLPNGTIIMSPKIPGLPVENWQPAESLYTEWENVGEIYGCSNWTPAVTVILKYEKFNQSATDCKQKQTRTIQKREQEMTTLLYRNIGDLETVEKITTVSSNRLATGTAFCAFSRDSFDLPNTFWESVYKTDNSVVNTFNLYVNGKLLGNSPFNESDYPTNTLSIDGTIYTRGNKQAIFTNMGYKREFYEICKY